MTQPDAPMTDDEREFMQRTSFNFFEATGTLMRIPPTLYDTLRASGVSMRYLVADASLEQ